MEETNQRIKKLYQFIEKDPNDPFVRFALAIELIRSERENEAVSYLEELIDKYPDYIGSYYHLGKLYEKINAMNKAARTYEAGMKWAKKLNDTHSLSELLSAYNALEKF